MKTYIIKEKTEVDKGLKKSLGWGIYDGERLVHDTLSSKEERVKHLFLLYSLGWCDVDDKQKWEFEELGL